METVHYIAGFLGCFFAPKQIPANFFPLNINNCPGAEYIITNVLAAFYLILIVHVIQVIRNFSLYPCFRTNMLVFFAFLLCGDVYSFCFARPIEPWTVAKGGDATVHLVLFFMYLYCNGSCNTSCNQSGTGARDSSKLKLGSTAAAKNY